MFQGFLEHGFEGIVYPLMNPTLASGAANPYKSLYLPSYTFREPVTLSFTFLILKELKITLMNIIINYDAYIAYMDKNFPRIYPYGEKDINELSDSTLIVIDTNILLDLYRLSEQSSNKIMSILEKFQHRLWIPFQIGYEFNKNRLNVINERKEILKKHCEDLKKSIKSWLSSIEKDKKFYEVNGIPQLKDISNNIVEKVSSHYNQKKEALPNYSTNDSIRDFLFDIFSNKIGDKLSNEELIQIYKEGAIRYQEKTPPGFKDSNKIDKQSIYGDLIIWFQIMKKSQTDQCSILFVTGDEKEDWWMNENGIHGPKQELLFEFYQKTGKMYFQKNLKEFIEYSDTILNQHTEETTYEEIDTLSKEKTKAMQHALEMSYPSEAVKRVLEMSYPSEAVKRALEMSYPSEAVKRALEMSYPSEAMQRALEMSYPSEAMQRALEMSYPSEAMQRALGFDNKNNELEDDVENFDKTNEEFSDKN